MSKKKESSKKDAKKTAEKPNLRLIEDPEPWVKELNTLLINDKNWQCNVNMVVERNSYNSVYLMATNEIFNTEQNSSHFIKLLSNSQLATHIMGMKYNKNAGLLDGYKRLSETAMKYCSPEGFSINTPTSIIASAIKYYIYDIKLKNLEESRIIEDYKKKKHQLREESLIGIQKIVKAIPISKEKGSAKSKKETKSTASKRGKQVQEEKFTEIRKRGEEVLDDMPNLTDEHEGGPERHLHIILNFFYQADLPLELLKIQVPLTALIKLNNFCVPDQNIINENENSKIANGLQLITQKVINRQRKFGTPQEQHSLNNKIIESFWKQFYEVLSNRDNVLNFKDTIFLQFYPKLYKHLLSKEDAAVTMYKGIRDSFYDQFCHLQYDIEDIKRQHQNFINNLIDCVIEEKQPYNLNKMSLYISQLESIPPEILNIPFIFNSILVQVEYLVDRKKNIETDSQSKKFSTDEIASDFHTDDDIFKEKLEELDVVYDLFDKETMITEEKPILPTILVYGDEVGLKTHWCDESGSVKCITCNMLKCFWETFLNRQLPACDDISFVESEENTDLFHMLKDTDNITVYDRLCNMPCTFDDTSYVVEDKAFVFCIVDDSEDNNCNDTATEEDPICDNQSCCDLSHKSLLHYQDPSQGHFSGQLYDKHSYCFEEMTSDILLQNLFTSLENFNCIDLLHDPFKNKYYLKFHHRKTCCKEEYQMGTLKTKTGIRDFYDYTIDEEFFWLNEEEELYDRKIKKKENDKLKSILYKLEYLKNRVSNMIKNYCSETNFKLYNTLKMTDASEVPKLPNFPSLIEDEVGFKPSPVISHIPQQLQSFNIDLPNRIQFSERKQEFIISENSHLKVKKLSRLYKDDALFLQSSIYGHTLYFFQPIDSVTTTRFHIISSSGIIFHFKKNVIDSNNPDFLMSKDINNESNIAATEFNLRDSGDMFLKPLFYELCFSLPSTLCLEFINPNTIPLYIKQYHLSKVSLPTELQNESFRCNLTEGKLIKFMNDETFIVYYPTGEIFQCQILKPTEENERNSASLDKQKLSTASVKQKTTTSINPQSEENSKSTSLLYDYTSGTGKRISSIRGEIIELESLLCSSSTDLFNGVIVTERSDGTVLTHNKEGTLIVDFPDGSRITTTAYFSTEEISFDIDETLDEILENNREELLNLEMEFINLALHQPNEYNSEDSYANYNTIGTSENFTCIYVQHYIEHNNFASVFINLNKEELNINLPYNVNISLSSEGLYNINFDQKAEFVTGYNNLIFQELNDNNIPKFVFHLSEKSNNIVNEQNKETNENKGNETQQLVSENDVTDGIDNSKFITLLSCEDSYGNTLAVTKKGDVIQNTKEGIKNICKCNLIDKNRVFVFDVEYCGLEVFKPKVLDLLDAETKDLDNCIAHNYGTINHQVMLVLKSLTKNEKENWLVPYKENNYFPLYKLPSTYNDETTFFNPFPKSQSKSRLKPNVKTLPNVLLIRTMNRVNCNSHLQEAPFSDNKKIIDLIRLNKSPELAIELFERGNIPFCKADKAFIEYIKNSIIRSLIARVRQRVVKRLENRKITEFTNILINRLLLPYFDSARGAVFEILLDVILMTVQLASKEENKLEALLCKPLQLLTDEDLECIHDTIAPLTVSRFCNCNENEEFCKLRILLLTGKTLYGIFPDMISIFYSYGRNVKKEKAYHSKEQKLNEFKKLLQKPSETLTEDDLVLLHDVLNTLSVSISFCTCHINIQTCKLKAILLATATLSFIFPNVESVLKSYKIDLGL